MNRILEEIQTLIDIYTRKVNITKEENKNNDKYSFQHRRNLGKITVLETSIEDLEELLKVCEEEIGEL